MAVANSLGVKFTFVVLDFFFGEVFLAALGAALTVFALAAICYIATRWKEGTSYADGFAVGWHEADSL